MKWRHQEQKERREQERANNNSSKKDHNNTATTTTSKSTTSTTNPIESIKLENSSSIQTTSSSSLSHPRFLPVILHLYSFYMQLICFLTDRRSSVKRNSVRIFPSAVANRNSVSASSPPRGHIPRVISLVVDRRRQRSRRY